MLPSVSGGTRHQDWPANQDGRALPDAMTFLVQVIFIRKKGDRCRPPPRYQGGDVLDGCEGRCLAHCNIECDDAADRCQRFAEVVGVSPHGDLKTVAVEAEHCLAEVTSNQSRAHAGARALGQVGRHSVGDGNRVAVQGQRRRATTNSLQIGVVEEGPSPVVEPPARSFFRPPITLPLVM